MHARYLLGWKTNRKIIVIESDDWGSFRFKNKQIRDKYIKNYEPNAWMHYNDCFESFQDLCDMQEALSSVKDKNNNTACFTFLMNPANPNFKKIKEAHFENYYFEPFTETLSKRDDGKQIADWYHHALNKKIIEIGFHGREHLNVKPWMQALKKGDKNTLKGFEDNIWGHNILHSSARNKRHRSTFQIQNKEDLADLKTNIQEGVSLLNKMFNQHTTYFVPPDGPFHLDLNPTLKENGIKYIGLAKKHNNPLEDKWYQTHVFWLGKKTKEGLKAVTRNVSFEPSSPRAKDWVSKAMKDIEKAFKYKSPAVISTHRANYMSSLNPQNKIDSLNQLKELLQQIIKKWPSVEFLTSSQLGELA